jgi:hypothetical protein
MKDGLKYTAIYMDAKSTYPHTIRLVPIETPRFPHGLAIGIWRDTREGAIKEAKLVDDYINLIIKDETKELIRVIDDVCYNSGEIDNLKNALLRFVAKL